LLALLLSAVLILQRALQDNYATFAVRAQVPKGINTCSKVAWLFA